MASLWKALMAYWIGKADVYVESPPSVDDEDVVWVQGKGPINRKTGKPV